MTSAEPWEVFLSPHSDDESIAMAGAITRAHLANRKTLVVLVTDNQPSERGRRQFGLSIEELDRSRRDEWRRAMACLLVDELQTWEVFESAMSEMPELSASHIQTRLQVVADTRSVVAVHTVWGAEDRHAETGFNSLSHVLSARAATLFARRNRTIPVSLHGVYVYSRPESERCAGRRPVTADPLSAKEWSRKRDALGCYKESADSIGYGYRSVPELFDAADLDPHEYVMDALAVEDAADFRLAAGFP